MKVNIDDRDLKGLMKYLKGAPKKFGAAQTMWVNRAAFGVRENILKHIRATMKVRKDSFVRRRILVQKASRSASKGAREAIVGSIRSARYTGWAEQEGLKEDKRDKVITPGARGGNMRKVMKPSARLKKGRNHPKPSDYAGNTRRKRANTMLQVTGRTRTRKPFLIMGHRSLPSGLWRFGSGPKGARDLEPLQLFDVKPARPKRNPWMTKSVDRYFRNMDRNRVWGDIATRLKALPKKKLR